MFVKNRIEDRMEAEMTVSGMEDMKMAASAATRRNSADRSCLKGPRNMCNAQGQVRCFKRFVILM